MRKLRRTVPLTRRAATGIVIAFFLFPLMGRPQNPIYHTKLTKQYASVVILATSSSVHIGSGNQEIYLAEISIHGAEQQLAKLVDRYSVVDYPVRASLLREHRTLKMHLIRHERCDVEEQNFFLPRNPKMIFDESAQSKLKENAAWVIPCYLVVHEDTRLAK